MRTEVPFSSSPALTKRHVSTMPKHTSILINKNWTFRQADSIPGSATSEYLPVAQFPTNIHLDLIANGIIPDPYIGKNELDVQWVGEAVWIYRTTFCSPAVPTGAKAVLAFDGLDTFATAVLNGREILKTESMFISERVDVTDCLETDDENVLEITFESAYLKGWEMVEKYPHHKWGCSNGDDSRLAVRKAQYHWGWDWGPTLLTCGPWRPVILEIYRARISDLYFTTEVRDSLAHASIMATADVEGSAPSIKFELSLSGELVAKKVVDVEGNQATTTFEIDQPKLWYPARYGKQPLYQLTATLFNDNVEAHSTSKRLGLRKAKLIQRPLQDQPGTTFFFEINNIPIFCGGSNWIPADSFIPRVLRERYYDWVKLVAEGNQNMIRVWGGGIYEEQALYDACDELGILVWQDFMFACGNYPAFPSILDLIKREAEDNVKLLRHHPSIVIWAGNNEDYQYAEDEHLTYDYANKDAESWLQTDFPARYIYENILADVCKALIPHTYYHYGSPWGGGKDTHDPTVGDIHQWNVWHGTQEKYQNFDKLTGRFVSEFGMQAFPCARTIDAYLPKGSKDPERYAQSSTIDHHNKAAGHERRLALYLAENLRYSPEPLEGYIYATQLMQAECLSSAYRLWKRQWKGPGKEYCGGALVWQMNDCWPVTSWSIVDHYLRPQLAYFAVKRELRSLTCGMIRRVHETPRDKYTRVHIKREVRLELWGCNLFLEDLLVDVVVKAWNVVTGAETYSETIHESFLLRQNRSTEVAEFRVPVRTWTSDQEEENRTAVAAYLNDSASGRQLARYVNWPEPLKYVHLQRPKRLKVEVDESKRWIDVSAEIPVKGLSLECEADSVVFGDNCVDIVPGEVLRIGVRGLEGSALGVRYLNMDVMEI